MTTLAEPTTGVTPYFPDYLIMINQQALLQLDDTINKVIDKIYIPFATDGYTIKQFGDNFIVYTTIFLNAPVPFVMIY